MKKAARKEEEAKRRRRRCGQEEGRRRRRCGEEEGRRRRRCGQEEGRRRHRRRSRAAAAGSGGSASDRRKRTAGSRLHDIDGQIGRLVDDLAHRHRRAEERRKADAAERARTAGDLGWVIMNAVGGDNKHSRIAASGSFPREIGDAPHVSSAYTNQTHGEPAPVTKCHPADNLHATSTADLQLVEALRRKADRAFGQRRSLHRHRRADAGHDPNLLRCGGAAERSSPLRDQHRTENQSPESGAYDAPKAGFRLMSSTADRKGRRSRRC